MPKKRHKIAVVGLWHLGEIYANGLANLGHDITAIDENGTTIAHFLNDIPPLPEPGLAELMKKNRKAGRIKYSNTMKDVKGREVVWFTFDTPVNDRDESDIVPMMVALRKTIPYLSNDVLIVVSSQIPAGTSAEINALVRKMRPGLKFHYAYSPENLRLGEALACFLEPERIVVGTQHDKAMEKIRDIFRNIRAEIVRMSPASAEMAKHALNAFLATSISFVNDIADACEAVGADVTEVVRALRSDPRIGQRAALAPGLGFSGGTLGRDLVSLMGLARKKKTAFPVIEQVYKKNAARPAMLVKRLEKILGGFSKKKIVLYGLTYKPGTTTLRRSRSIEVAGLLAQKGARIVLSDPHVPESSIPRMKGAIVAHDPYKASKNAHALVFLTPWPDFKDLNFLKLSGLARSHAVILDAFNLLHEKEVLIRKSGFAYYGIGR